MKTTSSARASQPSGRFFNGIALAVLGGLTVMGCLQEPDVIVRGEEGSPMGGLMGEGGRMGEGGAGGRELPSTETCNGLDDDQDGTLDEDLTPPPAALSEGVCIGQVQRCAGADGWQPPDLGAILDYEASERRCDALDNDCDGVTDEALEMACGVDEGACTAGVQQCEDGAFSACRSAVEPTPEVCDFVDNDCDGEVDDGLECACADGAQQECGTDIGLCQVGQQACVDGRWGPCEGEVGLTAEVCNNQDDDCDGQIDDSIAGIPTMCGTGECAAAGVSSCVAGEMVFLVPLHSLQGRYPHSLSVVV